MELVYSFVPSVIMITFNTMSGMKTLSLNSHLNRQDQHAIKRFYQRRRITISLWVIYYSFLIMTLPSTIFWAFFVNQNSDSMAFNIRGLLDFVSFLSHASVFFTSYLTNMTSNRYVNKCLLRVFCCRKSNTQNNQIILNIYFYFLARNLLILILEI